MALQAHVFCNAQVAPPGNFNHIFWKNRQIRTVVAREKTVQHWSCTLGGTFMGLHAKGVRG